MELKTFKKYYKAQIKPLVFNMGFRFNGNNCWRVVGDVYQAFYLHNLRYEEEFTINFNSLPLCENLGELPKTWPMGIGYDLREFVGKAYWKRDVALTSFFTSLFEEHLIPYFENSTTIPGIFSEIKRIQNNELANHPGENSLEGTMYEINPFVYLKLGMLDEALPILLNANPMYLSESKLDLERVAARDMDWLSGYFAERERENRIALGLEKAE